jgi:cytoskeletal protein CcmA (bactofilin family)
MGTGYTRNDASNNIADGNVINASDLDGEFDAVVATFNSSSGHTHDGTSAEGAPVTVVGPVQDLVVSATQVKPKTTNTLDLGTASLLYKDAYLQGNMYFRDTDLKIVSSADGQLDIDANTEVEITAPTLDIDASTAVTIDTTTLTITGSANVAGDLDVDNININGNTIISTDTNGNIALTPNGTGEVDISKVDIDSGAIDGVTLGTNSAITQAVIDSVNINGATIGHIDDTDLITLASGVVTVAGELDAVSLDISGDIDVDGTTNLDVVDIDGAVDMATTLAVAGNVDFNGDLDVDGTTNLDVVDIDGAVDMASTVLVTGVLTTTAATVFNGGFASNAASTLTVTEGNHVNGLKLINSQPGGYGSALTFQSERSDNNAIVSAAQIRTQGQDSWNSEASADSNLFFATSLNGSLTDKMVIKDDGNVGIGTSSPDYLVEVEKANGDHTGTAIAITNSQDGGYGSVLNFVSKRDDAGNVIASQIGTQGQSSWNSDASTSSNLLFSTVNANTLAERMRVTSAGRLLIGLSTGNGDDEALQVYRNGAITLSVARQQDGTIVNFRVGSVDGAAHGTISISGTTCSYNAFSGSHWSRLADNSKPTILKGTIIETIDEMCDWYRAEFTVEATTKEDTDSESETFGQQIEDVAEHIASKPIELPSGGAVGDTISVTSNGITYDNAVIAKEGDEKHVKCKISDTADSKKVYGVHAAWDNDDDTVNDMYVTAVGTHVVRINGSVTVSAGDLLASNGDGTAKVQDDDIIRSKTIGKVLTNIKQETYSDGSYTVPCALYCG